MGQASTIGLDIAKRVFQAHGVDAKPLGERIEGLAALGDDVDPARGRWLSRRRGGYNQVFTTAASSQQ